MGLLKPHLHVLCNEQAQSQRIRGETLTLGQLAVYATLDEARSLLARYGITPQPLPQGFDTCNKIPGWQGTSRAKNTNAQTVLSLLGADKVYVADVSAYEKPDFVMDLNLAIPPDLACRFDTILDAGTLEHVFDLPQALRNIAGMLRVGGSVAHFLPASNFIDHGFYSISPTLLYDFYQANGFEHLSCYLREGSPYVYEKKGRVYRYREVGSETPIVTPNAVEVLFFATKVRSVDQFEKPMQTLYRRLSGWSDSAAPNGAAPAKRAESKASPVISLLKRFKRSVLRGLSDTTRDWRPWFWDRWFFGRSHRKNIEYIGKF
jgi:hypothetical protein